jgi:hypothetical protein
VQGAVQDPVPPADLAEHRPVGDAGGIQPGLHRGDRAVRPAPGAGEHDELVLLAALVRLRPRQGEDQPAAGAEVLLEAVEGDRGGQHAGPDSRLGGVFVAHASCNAGDPLYDLGVALPPWQNDPDHTAGDLMPDDLMPDDRDARLAELHRLRLGDILYPGNSGCAGAR